MTLIQEMILHLIPLNPHIKAEIIEEDARRNIKYIQSDDLVRTMWTNAHPSPLHSGLLPSNCIALTAKKEQWTATLVSDFDYCTVSYHNTKYEHFPVPRILLTCQMGDKGKLSVSRLAIAEQGILKPDTRLFICPFPNVNDFSLCTGSNLFTGYDSLWKLRTLVHRVMALPFGDDYYDSKHTRLRLSARELFDHLKDKTPDYYYGHVLLPSDKTLSDFLGGAA